MVANESGSSQVEMLYCASQNPEGQLTSVIPSTLSLEELVERQLNLGKRQDLDESETCATSEQRATEIDGVPSDEDNWKVVESALVSTVLTSEAQLSLDRDLFHEVKSIAAESDNEWFDGCIWQRVTEWSGVSVCQPCSDQLIAESGQNCRERDFGPNGCHDHLLIESYPGNYSSHLVSQVVEDSHSHCLGESNYVADTVAIESDVTDDRATNSSGQSSEPLAAAEACHPSQRGLNNRVTITNGGVAKVGDDDAPPDTYSVSMPQTSTGSLVLPTVSIVSEKVAHVFQQEDYEIMGLDPSPSVDSIHSTNSLIIPLKSALKRTATQIPVDKLNNRKHRVRFNEALNTFLECDYVIYVDDDEYDLLYDFDGTEDDFTRGPQETEEGGTHTCPQSGEEPKLVSVRAFDLQLPETCNYEPPTEFVDHVTLSPPDGYKDALYGTTLERVINESGSESNCDSGADSPVEELVCHNPSSEPFSNGWASATASDRVVSSAIVDSVLFPPCGSESAPLTGVETDDQQNSVSNQHGHWSEVGGDGKMRSNSNHQQTLETADSVRPFPNVDCSQHYHSADSMKSETVADFKPATQLNGILKGGKLWRGSDSRPAMEKSPAVRFINLNNGSDVTDIERASALLDEDCDDGTDDNTKKTESSAGRGLSGIYLTSRNSHSAFQQLFPRARKFLQELPEAEIERLTTAARATTRGNLDQELKYEKPLRVTETEMEDVNGDTTYKANEYNANIDANPICNNPAANNNASNNNIFVRKTVDAQVIRRPAVRSSAVKQRRSESGATDSLIERLKWLTTDVEDSCLTEDDVAGVREDADGTSDLEAVISHSIPQEIHCAHSSSSAMAFTDQQPAAAQYAAVSQVANLLSTCMVEATALPAAVDDASALETPTNKNGKPAEKNSTYRKLNELFFRPKSKDKQKDNKNYLSSNSQRKGSNTSLNRSFSPPPPAEVEPKMKPSKKSHLIHIVGLPKSSLVKPTETLGRIPNVVPTVDHVYRAAVDLVHRDAAHLKDVTSVDSQSSGGDSYSLEDIDAALALHREGSSSVCVLHANRSLLQDDMRDDSGGSRSSGSSGDSGLGSHDTSMTNGDINETATSNVADSDELQAFVQQDQDRIDRIKKRYSACSDDESEDYGFLRRPSVRGIKPRFGSTSEIIQQMQAQLAPPAMASKVLAGNHMTWPYPEEQRNVHALLDPREKRRATMTNSVHLPALHEDVYYQGSGSNDNQAVREMVSRPPSVMNIYGSTGDLYQHLRATRPPVPHAQMVVRHPPSVDGTVAPVPHVLERTASVSSALDGASMYGSIRRNQVNYSCPVQISPTREVQHAVVPPHPHQIPLRLSISTPGYLPNSQLRSVPPIAGTGYVTAAAQELTGAHFHSHPSSTAPLPVRRQIPYGVPSPTAPVVVDTRYRQVLPNIIPAVNLRPTSAIHDSRYGISFPAKDEREGPEGASSSPGLTNDVSM